MLFFCPVLERIEHTSKLWTEKQHSSTKEGKLFHFSSHFSLFIKIPSTGLEGKKHSSILSKNIFHFLSHFSLFLTVLL